MLRTIIALWCNVKNFKLKFVMRHDQFSEHFQTGDRETRNAIFETVLTKPEPVTSLTLEDIQTG
jgi:hypothetical protein